MRIAASREPLLLSPTEAAYLAGIIDGEGTVFLARSGKRRTVRLSFYSTCREIVDWAHSRIGGSIVFHPSRHVQHADGWEWRVHSLSHAARVARAVLPYSIIKCKKLEAMISYCEHRLRNIRAPYDEVDEKLERQLKLA